MGGHQHRDGCNRNIDQSLGMPRCLPCACDWTGGVNSNWSVRHPDHRGHYQCMDQNVANADGCAYEELTQHIYNSCNAPESRDQSLAGFERGQMAATSIRAAECQRVMTRTLKGSKSPKWSPRKVIDCS